MSKKNGKFKNHGVKSKKTSRRVAAQARLTEYHSLTEEQKADRRAENKARYDASK